MRKLTTVAICAAFTVLAIPAWAQDAPAGGQAPEPAPPAAGGQAPEPAPPAAGAQQGQLPPVTVIQKKEPTAAPKAAPAQPAPQPEPDIVEAVPAEEPEASTEPNGAGSSNPLYGARGSAGAAARAVNGPLSPINPQSILPGNLERFPSAGTRVDRNEIDEFDIKNTNDAFIRVPGVTVVNDDGFGRHGGIGIRGSPPRRGRKVLHLEDGQAINMSVWLDPSVHYTPPIDRLDSIEVLRGTVVNQGPLNNFGIVNFRNLSPFGPNETVISAAIGSTENDDGFFDDDGEIRRSIVDFGPSNTRHFHTRRSIGNVGAVFSYSGAEVDGAWDTERLRYNDFYGALGWKGISSDLSVSFVYFRQRDDYDEANLEGEEEGEAEDLFFHAIQRCKSCFNPGSRFNTYNADVYKAQVVHNYFVDETTTITSRIYGFDHRRDRYQNFEGEDPTEADEDESPQIVGDFAFIPEGVMLGRLRYYRQLGGEVRAEFADRPFVHGLRQDIQTGIRYEYNDFTNKNFFGDQGQILEDGDDKGLFLFDRDYRANAVSAFLQSAIHVRRDFTVAPGARLEYYRVNRKTKILTEEEGEGEEFDDCNDSDAETGVTNPFGDEECVVIELAEGFQTNESFDKTYLLPGVAFSYTGFHRSTLYGGYHRGLTTHVLREERFPPGDEIGDDFQIGLRSTSIRGVTFDVAGFYDRISDFQIKGSGIDATGNNIYSTSDLVEIAGVEMYGRVDSQPFTQGSLNFFFEGNYTFSDARIEEDRTDPQAEGNLVPEVPRHFATLTAGLEDDCGWDVSVSYTYRGEFFTDIDNVVVSEEGEDGLVPDVWLLSARANYTIPSTGATLYVSGENLTDELYISDREDGIKPGQGRTYWVGFRYKYN